jgi:hypothetical protein
VITPLHILTACSRTEGLAAIAATLADAPAELRITWHVGYDLTRQHVGGQAIKNHLLDSIGDGWVWICDDDNLPAPGFFARLLSLPAATDMYLFGQQRPEGYAAPGMPRVGQTDAAQAVIRRSAIGTLRIPEQYDGDGHWIAAIYLSCHNAVLVNEPLTTYNAQRWQV